MLFCFISLSALSTTAKESVTIATSDHHFSVEWVSLSGRNLNGFAMSLLSRVVSRLTSLKLWGDFFWLGVQWVVVGRMRNNSFENRTRLVFSLGSEQTNNKQPLTWMAMLDNHLKLNKRNWLIFIILIYNVWKTTRIMINRFNIDCKTY